MSLPSINWPLLLLEYLKKLALPLEVYPAVKRLNMITNFDFSPATLSKTRRNALSLPEAQLMSLLIVVVKLFYPFDSESLKRYPQSLNEPAAQRIDWTAWIEVQKKLEDRGCEDGKLKRGKDIEVEDKDVFNMSSKQLDRYMDWYQETWIKPDSSEEVANKELLDMFPLKALPVDEVRGGDTEADLEEATYTAVREVHATMKTRRPISIEESEQTEVPIARPGMHYQRYRGDEDLSGIAKVFHEKAGNVACLSLESLLRAVFQAEQKIMIWRTAKRRSEKFGEEFNIEAEPGVTVDLDDRGQANPECLEQIQELDKGLGVEAETVE